MGSMPYEEYFPSVIELEQMEKDDSEMFETYRELMCHFYICMVFRTPVEMQTG